MTKATVTILAVMVVVLLIFIFPLVKVEGDSMFPTFREGRILICRRLLRKNKCKVGKIYVIYLKDDENGNPYFIIKRLKEVFNINGKTFYDFRGDNTVVSYDSRQHGLFSSNNVVAEVVGNYKNKYESYKKGEYNGF